MNVIASAQKLFRDRIRQSSFWTALIVATVGYFALTRVLQDWLYRNIQRPADLFASYGEKFVDPEPLEIPLYFLAYAIIPFFALGIQLLVLRFGRAQRNRLLSSLVVVIMFIALALVLLWAPWGRALHFFLRAAGYVQTRGVIRALWLVFNKRLFAATVITAGTGVAFGLAWLSARRRRLVLTPPAALERFIARWGILVVPLLAVLVFHPNFPYEPHHASYFIGPINDQLHGKPLLYETTSLYGIVSHYLLLAVFGMRILPFTYPALITAIMVVFFGFLVGLYFVLRRWLISTTYAVAGSLAVFSILYLFQTSPTRSVLHFPALTPWRFWPVLPVLALLVEFAKSGRRRLLRAAVAVSALAIFWNLETGLALSAATFLTLVFSGNGKIIPRTMRLVAEFGFWLIVFFSLINAINWLVYGKFPLWVAYLKELRDYAGGAAMYPLPAFGLYQLLVIAALAVLLVQCFRSAAARPDMPLLFVALYGAFGMLHYVGESTWQTLFIAVWPFAVLCTVVADRLASLPTSEAVYPLLVPAIVAAGFFFFALLVAKLPVEFAHRDYRTIAASFSQPRAHDAILLRDAEILRRDFPEVRLPLIHINDVRLLYLAGKTNWFAIYYSFPLYYKSQAAELAREVVRRRPPYVLIGNGRDALDDFQRVRANELNAYFRPLLPPEYVLAEQLETLDVYRRRTAE